MGVKSSGAAPLLGYNKVGYDREYFFGTVYGCLVRTRVTKSHSGGGEWMYRGRKKKKRGRNPKKTGKQRLSTSAVKNAFAVYV